MTKHQSIPGESEHDDQVRIFAWAEISQGIYPTLRYLYANINGAKLPYKRDASGKRFSPEAFRLKAEGLRSGVPDITLPVPIGTYHGFYLELKHGSNKPSPEQIEWLQGLRDLGYCTEVAWGWEEGIQKIQDYLEGRL